MSLSCVPPYEFPKSVKVHAKPQKYVAPSRMRGPFPLLSRRRPPLSHRLPPLLPAPFPLRQPSSPPLPSGSSLRLRHTIDQARYPRQLVPLHLLPPTARDGRSPSSLAIPPPSLLGRVPSNIESLIISHVVRTSSLPPLLRAIGGSSRAAASPKSGW
jgi:hypothetical protein